MIPHFIVCSMILVRVLVGFHPHSGQDNYHGKDDGISYGGDYEAQRHWMELTLHLPMRQWYTYDLEYWGLDYPPLTAYVSYLCGIGSSILVGPETVALLTSRGYEDPLHKAYMRATVLFFDVLIYFSAVWMLAKRLGDNDGSSWNRRRWWIFLMALLQPSILLIDHGHFQYNTFSLGLALWSFHFITYRKKDSFNNFHYCIYGSIFFCLALNFKQMILYYAPSIFAYLLGRCFTTTISNSSSNHTTTTTTVKQQFLFSRFLLLGVTVILTFGIVWMPFVINRDPNETSLINSLFQIIHRLFPFQRGLFEGKVANIWCALSTKPISIRKRLSPTIQPILALALTIIMMMPFCIKLFLLGKHWDKENTQTSQRQNHHQLCSFLWGSGGVALSFFLASFQVHEKSILIPLAPLSLLFCISPLFVVWFSLVSLWTMWPLLLVDRLTIPYITCAIIFASVAYVYFQTFDEKPLHKAVSFGFIISILFMIVLHFMELVLDPPQTLPDIYPVLFSLAGCGMFTLSWCYCCWELCWNSSYNMVQKSNTKID